MIELQFNTETSSWAHLKGDENLDSAIQFVEQWNSGAAFFTFKSSGSTGQAKDIVLSKTFLIESAKRTINLFEIKPEHYLLLCLNTSFMGGLMMVVRSLVAKCHLIYLDPSSVSIDQLNQLPSIQLASLVPSQVKKLTENNDDGFKQIKHLLIGGASIDKDLEQLLYLKNKYCSFYHTYGMTETASHVALKNISKKELHYTALQDYAFAVDERNCLTIHYQQAPYFTLQTNDIVNLLSPQHFEWIGRADWVVNSGGIKFNLEVAEDVVALFFKHQNVTNVLFTSVKTFDPIWGERWVLLIANTVLNPESEEALRIFCESHLGQYVYPKEIKYTKKIVYLPSGKIDRLNTYKQVIS